TGELWFYLASRGTNQQLTLLRFLSGSGSPIATIQIAANGRLVFRNESTGTTTNTTVTPSANAWHQLRLRLVTGASGRIELWYDGSLVASGTQNLGNSPVARLQIGEHVTRRTFDLRFDDVRVTPPMVTPPDTTPPETTLTAVPAATTEETTATFAFVANEPATFRCSLDGAPAQPCTSPITYSNLTVGLHTFSVTATDAAGNNDPTPATYAWEITRPSSPDTTLVSAPPSLSNQTSATFTFTSTDAAATFECQLDNLPAESCTSPWTVSGLSEGPHTFQVRAIDGEGNADLTPATWTWTVDVTPPPAPRSVSAVAVSGTQVSLAWSTVTDPNGLHGYDVYRN
ncbi:MAG: hypothetical protein NZL87_10285, partial [Thermomicrobium sp.]|nr:hypothetical protein [Thermomicrobium sp.]